MKVTVYEQKQINWAPYNALNNHYREYLDGFRVAGGLSDEVYKRFDVYYEILKKEWGITELQVGNEIMIIEIEDEQRYLHFLMAYG